MNSRQILARIPADDVALKNHIESLVNRMMGQLRQSFAKLSSVNKNDIEKLFMLSLVAENDLNEIVAEYPGGGFVMSDPLYSLIMFIAVKYHMELNDRMAQTTSLLLSLIMLARLKYKYIRICDPKIMDAAFSMMSKKTYVGTKGITWAVMKISMDTFNKYKEKIKKNPNDIYYRYRYIIDIRNKFNQLMKHIATMYYYVVTNGVKANKQDVINDATMNIINYMITNELNAGIINLISELTKESIDIIYEFQHDIQLNNNFQNRVQLIVAKMYSKFLDIKTYSENQNVPIDYNSKDFLKEFYNNFRRSSVVVSLAKDPMFADKGYSSNLVIAICSTLIVLWNSVANNTAEELNTTTDVSSNNPEIEYQGGELYSGIYENKEFSMFNLEENFSEIYAINWD